MNGLYSFQTGLDSEYGDLAEVISGTAADVDLITVQAHHIEYGHSLEGLLESYELDVIPGISDWFQEVGEEFCSPEGIPLPFADAIQQAAGMPADQAIEWLSVNITDAIEIGTEAVIMAFFRKNPTAYSICMVLGIAFGLYSNNTLLVAMNGLQYFCKLRREGRLQKGIWVRLDRFLRVSLAVTGKTCAATFIADKTLELMGVHLPEMAGHIITALRIGRNAGKTARFAIEAASTADFVEGISNFGLSLLVAQGIGKLVNWFNDDTQKELARVGSLLESKQQLLELVNQEVPPETLMPIIELMMDAGAYQAILA